MLLIIRNQNLSKSLLLKLRLAALWYAIFYFYNFNSHCKGMKLPYILPKFFYHTSCPIWGAGSDDEITKRVRSLRTSTADACKHVRKKLAEFN